MAARPLAGTPPDAHCLPQNLERTAGYGRWPGSITSTSNNPCPTRRATAGSGQRRIIVNCRGGGGGCVEWGRLRRPPLGISPPRGPRRQPAPPPPPPPPPP